MQKLSKERNHACSFAEHKGGELTMELTPVQHVLVHVLQSLDALDDASLECYFDYIIRTKLDEARLWLQEAELFQQVEDDCNNDTPE